MARKCGSCGVPAPDGESKFCNRCGAAIVDEQPEPQLPVCSTCGARVADPMAQFCDKCGGPVRKAMACPTCGNPAIDENSKFCTRCGATFVKPGTCPACGFINPDEKALFCNRCGAALKGAGPVLAAPAAAPSVIIPKKRTSLPVQEEQPAPDWDPWSDGAEHEIPPAHSQQATPPYAYQQPVPEDPSVRPPQIRVPQKKYSHLPLVADEMKDYKNPSAGTDAYAEPSSRERTGNKGVRGFLKK